MADAPRARASRLPTQPGVYRFRSADGAVLYLGRAVDLRRRVLSYWSGLRDRAHLARMVASIAAVEAVPCASEHEAAWLERNVLEHELPPWNLTRGGQEAPVRIELDPSPVTPRIMVVRDDAAGRHVHGYGLYLGGSRARRVVSAVQRVFPISYAGTGLTGTARDMAEALGVGPRDRAELLRAIRAVLGGEPEAVEGFRTELQRLRAVAAASQAFERAAELQAEIEAVDWLLAPQRVTGVDGADHDIYGWADERLVGFEVRGGRVCRWVERNCSRADAVPLLARTPERWRSFTDEAARLAALLAA